MKEFIHARFPGTCAVCRKSFSKGQWVGKQQAGWAHKQCAQAYSESTRKATRIPAGNRVAYYRGRA